MKPAATHSRRRILFRIIWVLFVLLLFELTARGFLCVFARVSPLHPDRIVYSFYPELRPLMQKRVVAGDRTVDVLLLGGSALNVRWSTIRAFIAERLTREVRRPVLVHSLAVEAHTSRDSLIKYKRLHDKRFDVVVFYHGINEMRANNAPAEVFDKDYEHYSWYRFVNAIDRDRWLPFLALPYTVRHVGFRLRDRLGASKLVPTDGPRQEWVKHGLDVKTAEPFRRNLSAILDLAESRAEPVLLLTFATHVAEGYSKEAFEAVELDYTRHRCAIDMWGTPEAVIAGVEAHNAVVRELAATRGIPFVDQAALMPGERQFYDDLCHFTVKGSELFVENMMPSLRALIQPQQSP